MSEQPMPQDAAQENEQAAAEQAQAAEQPMTVDVILASGSPRRKELLEREGVNFTIRVSEVDESLEPDLEANPPEAVKKLAERKAGAVVQEVLGEGYTGMAAIIGADTMVVCDGEIFGKPASISDAKRMLSRLQGNTHEVLTGVSVWLVSAPNAEDVSLGFRTFVDRAAVTFHPQTDEQLAEYLKCGESFDKAGAYAAQGNGAKLIKHVEGDLDTVIGLPVTRLLKEFPDLKEPAVPFLRAAGSRHPGALRRPGSRLGRVGALAACLSPPAGMHGAPSPAVSVGPQALIFMWRYGIVMCPLGANGTLVLVHIRASRTLFRRNASKR